MNIEEILAYLNINSEDLSKLQEFLNEAKIKDFLSNEWKIYNSPPNDLETDIFPIEPVKDIPNKLLSEETMLIPNIPNEENTQANRGEEKDLLFDHKLKSKHIQFKNGKVNQEYQDLFDITTFDIVNIGEYWFDGLEEIGLHFNTTTDLIEGVPNSAGDHKITLKCKPTDWKEGDQVYERQITLIVNPDPRSLWNSIPTPENIEYYKPDSAEQYIKVETTKGILGFGKKERKDIVAASQRGRSHAHEGTPRDDDFKIKYQEETDWYLTSVADGAGSAKYSRKGSQIACDTVSNTCLSQLVRYDKDLDILIKDFHKDGAEDKRKKLGDALYNILGSAVFKAYKNIEEEALSKNNSIKDYATTMLVSISKKFKFGWFVASFWIGDGAIGIYNKETQFLKIMGEPDGGEFAGQTRFLTMPELMQPNEIYKRLRFEIVDDFTALILMSDGVTDPKFETDANLQKIEKWNNLWEDLTTSVDLIDNNEAAADQLLKWLDFWSQGNHDDRTIVILY